MRLSKLFESAQKRETLEIQQAIIDSDVWDSVKVSHSKVGHSAQRWVITLDYHHATYELVALALEDEELEWNLYKKGSSKRCSQLYNAKLSDNGGIELIVQEIAEVQLIDDVDAEINAEITEVEYDYTANLELIILHLKKYQAYTKPYIFIVVDKSSMLPKAVKYYVSSEIVYEKAIEDSSTIVVHELSKLNAEVENWYVHYRANNDGYY